MSLRRAAAICALLALAWSARAVTVAWWLSASFEPTGSEVAGLPIGSISPKWVGASELGSLPLPPGASEPGESLAEHGAAFERTLDLDHDGLPERVVVGVYTTAAGATGRFLLATRANAKRARPIGLLEVPGGAGFSALFVSGAKLVWASCMECDASCEVRLRTAPTRLECAVEPDGD